MCACHNPEYKRDCSVGQNPDGVPIFAEHEKKHDLDDTFANQNYAHYRGEKNNSEQRIYQQIDCSQAVEPGDEGMPSQGAAAETDPEDEMSNGRKHKKPT